MIEEMQKLPFPRATRETLEIKGIPPEENEEYVKHFLPINFKDKWVFCICGERLFSFDTLMGVLMGATFEWGIQHGDGHCCKCGWPTRMFHEFSRGSLTLPLQYHPDELVKRQAASNTKSA